MKKSQILISVIAGVILYLILSSAFWLREKDSLSGKVNFIAAPLSYLGQKTSNAFSSFRNIASLRQQNRELTAKIIQLEVDRSRIDELEYENKILKKELGFIESTQDETLIPARIIGREPTTFLDYVVLDRGTSEGVELGMAVVSEGILIGQITETTAHQSRVNLITSKDSIVQSMLQSSRAKGILRGGISGLVLDNITQDAEFTPGEYIVTSGLGGELPEGMLIGRARAVHYPASGIFRSVSVEPLVDLVKLEMVFIVKR